MPSYPTPVRDVIHDRFSHVYGRDNADEDRIRRPQIRNGWQYGHDFLVSLLPSTAQIRSKKSRYYQNTPLLPLYIPDPSHLSNLLSLGSCNNPVTALLLPPAITDFGLPIPFWFVVDVYVCCGGLRLCHFCSSDLYELRGVNPSDPSPPILLCRLPLLVLRFLISITTIYPFRFGSRLCNFFFFKHFGGYLLIGWNNGAPTGEIVHL